MYKSPLPTCKQSVNNAALPMFIPSMKCLMREDKRKNVTARAATSQAMRFSRSVVSM